MFFNTKLETIVRKPGLEQSVFGGEKENIARDVNGAMKSWTQTEGTYVRWADDSVNVVEESISRAPMFCNMIANRGYSNILFVGHHQASQSHWMLDQYAGRMIDVMPPERTGMHTFPDLNIVAQFIPAWWKWAKYDASMTVMVPPSPSHQGAMHGAVYPEMGLSKEMMPCSAQYQHGMSSWEMNGSTSEKFDAVVFLGVPMAHPETGFEEDQVRETFAPYCTEDFDIIDIWYGAPSPNRWINGEEQDSSTGVEEAFAIRSIWDGDVQSQGGRPEEEMIMKGMVKIF